MKVLGQIIKLFRKNAQLTQVQLANACSVTPEYVSKIENGAKTPSMELLKKISVLVNIPLPIILLLSMDQAQLESVSHHSFGQTKPLVEKLLGNLLGDPNFNLKNIQPSINKLKKSTAERRALETLN